LMALTPPSAPLSRGAGEGTGVRVGLSRPTAYAVGYSLPPAPRARFFNEPLVQDTSFFRNCSSFK